LIGKTPEIVSKVEEDHKEEIKPEKSRLSKLFKRSSPVGM